MQCLDKIVKEPVKVDFHIHSIASKWADGDRVKNNKIENLDILVKKLNDNKINMVSITDHDNFDYHIYSKLKKEEQKTSSSIKKVIPGVEFDVKFDKSILHIIALFDDSDDNKIKSIQSKIFNDSTNRPKFGSKNNYFSKNKFLNILRDIGINFVLIAHQKGSPYSKKKRKHDFDNLSKLTQNELLCVGFFDAFEFKNKNNEIFNKLNAKDVTYKSNDKNYITGSDSHDWNIYPNSNDGKFDNFTYLKCLPSFRGLTLALTSKSRIRINANNFFNSGNNNIDAINLSINKSNQKIMLSNGINVIIGENSIGKSLLLHKLTNYKNCKIKSYYEKFLTSNKIEINTNINTDKIFRFDYQGSIRELFERGKISKVFAEYYPQKPEYDATKKELEGKVSSFIDFLNNKKHFLEKLNELNNINIEFDESRVSEIKSLLIKQDLNVQIFDGDINSLKNISKLLSEILQNIRNISKNELFEDSDKNKISKYADGIEKLLLKYGKILKQKEAEKNKILLIKGLLDKLNNKLFDEKTYSQSSYEEYIKSFQSLSNQISDVIKIKNKLNFNLIIDDKLKDVKPNTSIYGEYLFVSKTKCTKFDESYIFDLLKKFLKKTYADDLKITDIKEIDPNQFEENIKLQPRDNNIFDEYKEKILDEIDNDFTIENYITFKNELDPNKHIEINKLSNGTNALIFFDLLSYKDEPGVYLIDQPEDDVSQKSIHDKLIPYLQKISHKHQIILITHNPQLVVNLDVDNVIFIDKNNKTGEISIKYGALEYKNTEDKTNILDIIVNNLEGGMLALKERYNRYEKNNYF